MSIVRVAGLRKALGSREVLRGIDAHVEQGETITIVGPSGGGKSTFLRCLNGLNPFDSGVVEIARRTHERDGLSLDRKSTRLNSSH